MQNTELTFTGDWHSAERLGKREAQVIKGVSVCLLLIHHLFYVNILIQNCSFLIPQSRSLLKAFAVLCKVCVAIFVLLSGYGLCQSYTKYLSEHEQSIKNAAAYAFRHIRKLLIQYWWAVIPLAVFGAASGLRTLEDVYGEGFILHKVLTDFLGINYNLYGYSNLFCDPCWYIGLAIGLYILFPVFYWLQEKSQLLLISVSLLFAFLPFRSFLLGETRLYVLPFVMGMFAAKYRFFDYICTQTEQSRAAKAGAVLLLLAAALIRHDYPLVFDGIFALAIIIIVLMTVPKVKVLEKFFAFLGKHSANIFMTHAFFYLYYLPFLIYAPRYPVPVFGSLLGISVVYSLFLEAVKGFFNKLVKKKITKTA